MKRKEMTHDMKKTFLALCCVALLTAGYAWQTCVADYTCSTCPTGCNLNDGGNSRVLTDPRNGADPGSGPGGPSSPASGINDNYTGGFNCLWGMAPGLTAIDTVWFNQSAIPSKVKLWFVGWPSNCSDPRDFTVEFHQPGFSPTTGWTSIISITDKPNDDSEMERYSPSEFPQMLADGVRVHVTKSNQGVTPVPPNTGIGEWFSIAEIVVEGDTPTPTPTITPTPTLTPIPSPTPPASGVSANQYRSY